MKFVQSCLLLFVVALVSTVGLGSATDVAPVFKIYVEHDSVYEVPYERLVEAGLGGPMPTATIGLRNLGEPVPVWVEDGGDGVFGPHDRILFLGETLRGGYSYLDPFSRFNCYVLDYSDPDPWHGVNKISEADETGESSTLLAYDHLERDHLMVRFHSRRDQPEEEWYWARLSVADKRPWIEEITLDGLVLNGQLRAAPTFADALSESLRGSGNEGVETAGRIQSQIDSVFDSGSLSPTSVRLRLGLRGWSEPRHRERTSQPHHQVEVRLNGRLVDQGTWDGTEHHVLDLEIPSRRFLDGANELSFDVPKRVYPESGDLVVDVVLLNWIELEYVRVPRLSNDQLRLRLADPDTGRRVKIAADDGGPIDLYVPGGIRFQGENGAVAINLADHVDEFSVLRSNAAIPPDEIVMDRASDLATDRHQADYIMITHRSLRAGSERLADFHRSRGLTVEVVDVQDIFDEFNSGLVAPRAIKDFLEHAHSRWRSPAPRFVLLVGDASWDYKNATADDSNYADWTYRQGENRHFVKNRSTSYAEGAGLNHRNLVPTSSYLTREGHAASDTWFVCFDDGDTLPDMAIGRLPVVNPEELDGVIDKTIAFASEPPVGPWRRNLLFIANESASFQRRSDQTADKFSRLGYVPTKIYPHPTEPANEHHSRRILEILDNGVLGVHFIGHGGRYIWRTGPPDLKKNHDLFTLDHLDELADNDRLSVVLSLTCYSAPFDHPTADSIGEKMIRIPRKGAIAVFAASWRNSPSPVMGERLLEELTIPGNTIGEAVMRAKHEFHSDILVQTYNLLGDPAVPVAAPAHALDIVLEDTNDGLTLHAAMPVPFDAGWLVADWVAQDGSVLRQDRIEVSGSDVSISLDRGVLDGQDRLSGVRVYVWDDENRVDGIGWVDLATEETNDPQPVSGLRATAGTIDVGATGQGRS